MPTLFFMQVKSQKTVPIVYGSVIQFLLYGDYKEDVYATGGLVEVALVNKFVFVFFRPCFLFACLADAIYSTVINYVKVAWNGKQKPLQVMLKVTGNLI